MSQGLKFALELGPLLLFFVINAKAGIMPATAAFMAATILSLAFSYLKTRKLPVMPLVGGVFIMTFGGLTLVFDDDTFIKLKPTIVNTLFGLALFTGMFMGKNFLKTVLESALSLQDEGWRKLTWRWAWFFLFLAVLNEIVWRTQTTDMWVNFKVFGIMPITLLFSFAQLPLIFRYQIKDEDGETPEPQKDQD